MSSPNKLITQVYVYGWPINPCAGSLGESFLHVLLCIRICI